MSHTPNPDAAATSRPAAATPPIARRIDHVGIAVHDLEAATTFFRDIFGAPTVHTETNTEQGVTEAMVDLGNASFQFLAPLREDSPIGSFLARRGEGLQQVALEVEDIDRACADLRSRGVRLLYAEPRTGTAGSRINFTHPKDTFGVLIELVEPVR